jgi:fermentation-respiration switch protein FrsA (DUF1100 family)
MKKNIVYLMISLPFVLLVGCELDGFLFNTKKLDAYQLPGNTIPSSLIEQVTFKSGNNTLYGYWVNSSGERSGLTILYCHGNKYHIDHYWDRVMFLHRLGVNVFIFDYRGFGMSDGTSSEEGLYADGRAALDYVMSQKAVKSDSLILYGYSLGNVVSIYLAAERINPLCLIAEAPFASANSLTQDSLPLDIPARWLTEGQFDNAERIKHISTPFLLLHGANDDFVRYRDNGKIVFQNAPQPKKEIVISGANHTDIPQTLGVETYLDQLQEWFDFAIKNAG